MDRVSTAYESRGQTLNKLTKNFIRDYIRFGPEGMWSLKGGYSIK